MDRQPASQKLLTRALRLDFASIAQGGVAMVIACSLAYLVIQG